MTPNDTFSMDPATELNGVDSAHVLRWKQWYQHEGRQLDNARRHPDFRLDCSRVKQRFNVDAFVHLLIAFGCLVTIWYWVVTVFRL